MTRPDKTTNPSDTISQILALQSRRLAAVEATLREIKTMLEEADPMEPQEGA